MAASSASSRSATHRGRAGHSRDQPGIIALRGVPRDRRSARSGNDNAQREYYLTDLVGIAVGGGLRVTPVTVDDPDEVAGINRARARGGRVAGAACARRALDGRRA